MAVNDIVSYWVLVHRNVPESSAFDRALFAICINGINVGLITSQCCQRHEDKKNSVLLGNNFNNLRNQFKKIPIYHEHGLRPFIVNQKQGSSNENDNQEVLLWKLLCKGQKWLVRSKSWCQSRILFSQQCTVVENTANIMLGFTNANFFYKQDVKLPVYSGLARISLAVRCVGLAFISCQRHR